MKRKNRKSTPSKSASGPQWSTVAAVAIIVLVGVAVAIYAYELNNKSSPTPAPHTHLTGRLTPKSSLSNFTYVFFSSVATRLTYSAPVYYGNFSINLYSGFNYSATIMIFTGSTGYKYCATAPGSIFVTGANQTQSFDCYGIAG